MNRLAFFFIIIAAGCKSIDVPVADNQTLFTVGDMAVDKDEFIYAYTKNNVANDSIYTRDDIEEYLNLYIKFKLKIAEAKSRGMDTVPAFINEYNGYLEQLKKPYLTEKSVTEKLLKEAYDRFGKEVRAAHILIGIEAGDTLAAYNKALALKRELEAGVPFRKVAVENSTDPSVKMNGGDLGYFTSFQMVYPFESAAYNTPVGEVSDPVRTQFGYHLVFVKDRRPANGKVQVAHIMLRHQADTSAIRNKIFDIYEQASRGVEWDELVQQYSEDVNSKRTNGSLRAFGVAQMPFEFQEAAFALEEAGQISDPVKTQYGWHIIKLINREGIESFDEMRPNLEARIARDARAAESEKVLVNRLMRENGFALNNEQWQGLLNQADSSLITGHWEPEVENQATLMTVGDRTVTIGDFIQWFGAKKATSHVAPKAFLNTVLESFKKEQILKYESDHLANKYEDFKMLSREYYEGILLFELMEKEVWNKAVEDTVGLRKFYERQPFKYRWDERLDAVIYTTSDAGIIAQLESRIRDNDSTVSDIVALNKQYNQGAKRNLEIQKGTFEKGAIELLSQVPWQSGTYTRDYAGKNHLIWIREVLSPQVKKLNEARGEVISDYQSYLEDQFVEKLREKYFLKMNEDTKQRVYHELENRN